MKKIWTAFSAVLGALAFAGCSLFLRSTPSPIPTQRTQSSAATRTETLVIFLPGRGGSPGEFERKGFVQTLRDAGVNVDTVSVDAHLGYYYNRSVIERLQADVIQPARKQGYRRIVVVGISLGGLGALLNERDQPGTVDAIVVLAPYLGRKDALFDRIAEAGGPAVWARGRDPQAGTIEEQAWTFLGTHATELPPTWLLWGERDRYARGHRLLATLLPKERVRTIDGAHDWPTWSALWKQLCVDSDLFSAEKAGGGAR